MRRKLAAGNWKMNGLQADLAQISALAAAHPAPGCDILICPPATLLSAASRIIGTGQIRIGGQDCAPRAEGAHTGDISAQMLADAGATHVILGHSERRENHDERNETVRAKALAANAAGLTTIICTGESLHQHEAARTLDTIAAQLAASVPDTCTGENLVIAYEPIWAIGTGLVPNPDQIAEVHDFIRARLEHRFGAGLARAVRLLYGGSVKPENAADIFGVPNVDGALVGGASLKQSDFSPIIQALENAN